MRYYGLLLCVMVLIGCERPIMDEVTTASKIDPNANVTLHFEPYVQSAFADSRRAQAAVGEWCSRLNLVVFKQDGTKAKSVSQKRTDEGFGSVSIGLPAGTYKLVAIGHNCDGTATISTEEKVTFSNNKVTDTFYYYGTLEVGDDQVSETLPMKRCVAMMCLTLTEPLPESIERLKFYYTGGSSTFSPATGYGCVQSKQTEYRDCRDADGQPVTNFALYTMPHTADDVLKLTVTALTADGSEVGEVTMENIPVAMNKITEWTGAVFSDNSGSITNGGITISLDGEWDGTIQYTW